jgi:DNA-binding MarR family transcriptional regulator
LHLLKGRNESGQLAQAHRCFSAFIASHHATQVSPPVEFIFLQPSGTSAICKVALYQGTLHNGPGQSIGVHVKKPLALKSAGAGTLYLLHMLTHASRSKLDDALRHLELSSFQYTILSVLAHNRDLSSSRLSRRFYVTPQTMGEVILLLERKGLIERREDPANKKALLLSLTKLGQTVCAEGDVIVTKFERMIFGDLSSAELVALRAILSNALSSLRTDDHSRRDRDASLMSARPGETRVKARAL